MKSAVITGCCGGIGGAVGDHVFVETARGG